jgi:uncharacterized protein YdbL (DUF1318 family)
LKLLALGLLAACVTVNVYFPAAAAEQAADRIIDTVTNQPGGAPKSNNTTDPSTAPKTPPNSRNMPEQQTPENVSTNVRPGPGQPRLATTPAPSISADAEDLVTSAATALLNLLIPEADAQGAPNLDISDPQIRAVTTSMQQRFGEMKKYFDSGVIGLTVDGQVAIREQNAVPLAERATVARLVSEDNRDRATLYAELAKANKHPEWEPDIRRTFARRWVERGAQPGWYYQDNGGNWLKK